MQKAIKKRKLISEHTFLLIKFAVFNRMSSTKVRKCQVKEVSSGAGTKAQIPVLHAKIAADKSLEAATERITSAPQATTAKFEVIIDFSSGIKSLNSSLISTSYRKQ